MKQSKLKSEKIVAAKKEGGRVIARHRMVHISADINDIGVRAGTVRNGRGKC